MDGDHSKQIGWIKMKKTSDILNQQLNRLAEEQDQKEPSSKQGKSMHSARQKRLVSALWAKMSFLFPNKWESSQGELVVDGVPSEGFLIWLNKTSELTDDQWKLGVESLEKLVERNSTNGKESWPPSYAEFLGLCRPTVSPSGGNSDAYKQLNDPTHSCYTPRSIEDKSGMERRKKVGKDVMSGLLASF